MFRDFPHFEEYSGSSKSDCEEAWLRDAFTTLLRQKLGIHAAKTLTPKKGLEALRHFDVYIKRQFNPYVDDCNEEYEICLAGAPDTPEIGGYQILQQLICGPGTRSTVISSSFLSEYYT